VKIFTGSVIWSAPSTKMDTGTLSKDTIDEESAPAATPGRIERQCDRGEGDRPAGAENPIELTTPRASVPRRGSPGRAA
jgi:hypothetical protein